MVGKIDYSRFIVGYHGGDAQAIRNVLLGEEPLAHSRNDYDWLGSGIYFWEQGPARAFEFAVAEAKRKPSKIKNPDVVGAYIFLGNCFDLLDVNFTKILAAFYDDFVADLTARGEPIPTNERMRGDGTKLLHRLDRAVIEYTLAVLELNNGQKFDSVRGAFVEGDRIYPDAEIYQKTHIQIAVRNPDCILGYFKPKLG